MIYKPGSPKCIKFFNFNNFINNIDSDLFLTKPDSLPCTCNNFHFVDRHHIDIVTEVLRIINQNVLRKIFIKELKYRDVRPIDLEKSK